MTTTDIMNRLCQSHRMLKPYDWHFWYINASARQMDVIRVARCHGGPWFEVAR